VTTFGDVIKRAKNYLMTGQPDRLNVLQTSVDNSPATTTIQFLYDLNGVNPGTTINIDLEEMHVVSITGQIAGSTAQVIRAVNGSTIASHSANALIEVSPQFSSYRIAQSINTNLSSLSAAGLFQIKAYEFPYIPATSGYNIVATDFIDVWRVRYNIPGPGHEWPVLRPDQYRIDQNPNTTDFPNLQLVLYEPAYPGGTVRVSYKAGFTPLSAITDNVLTISGLHTEAHDIPALGAAIDLAAGRELKRTFLNRQPEPRRQDEVPVGSIQRSILGIMQQYNTRLTEEVRRLRRRFPGAH
jgi:hypothetical protein